MKKKTKDIIIFIWLSLLTAMIFSNETKIEWLQNQQDNVIEVLLTEK